jgi:hypothetical protein
MYELSCQPGLQLFRHVFLCACTQDKYVPFHSARIELSAAAAKDNGRFGACYRAMVRNILSQVRSATVDVSRLFALRFEFSTTPCDAISCCALNLVQRRVTLFRVAPCM